MTIRRKMKRELISFVIGAGIVGCIWAGTAIRGTRTEEKDNIKIESYLRPNSLKKVLPDIYSAENNKNYPGMKLYNTDFLIPLNRLEFTEYGFFDDPKEDYGSGNAPMSAVLFRIREKGKYHYFMSAGRQWGEMSKIVYLGENIDIEKVKHAGNGYVMATYKDGKGRNGNAFVPVSYITGSAPTDNIGVAQNIEFDPLLKYAESCDPFVHKMTAEQLWERLKQALRENDKMTIAKMISFPMDFGGERIYTRAEFADRFDEIFYPEYKAAVLKMSASKIWYSWRGAGLPDNCSWCRDAVKGKSAGPLTLNSEWWRGLNK